MLDVHPPHEPVHGWRDFLLHILTITIGLLIALGLEGLVEWQHHRHLVHEAEASLHHEIETNARQLPKSLAQLHKEQGVLKQDLTVLNYIVEHGKAPEHSSLRLDFNIETLDNVGWKTAQASGALAYMPYSKAEEYADIFADQDELFVAEQQAARDVIVSMGTIADNDDERERADPTGGKAALLVERVQTLRAQLLLVESVMNSLNKSYAKFLASDHV